MMFLKEILTDIQRMDSKPEQDLPDPENQNPDSDNELEDLPPEDQESNDDDLDDVASEATEDPDRQGLIRKVQGAHLVYKRESEDGTYEELWIYNSGDSMKDELNVRRSILSGTDISVNKTSSDDGKQNYSMWSVGNIEMVHIKGLPN